MRKLILASLLIFTPINVTAMELNGSATVWSPEKLVRFNDIQIFINDGGTGLLTTMQDTMRVPFIWARIGNDYTMDFGGTVLRIRKDGSTFRVVSGEIEMCLTGPDECPEAEPCPGCPDTQIFIDEIRFLTDQLRQCYTDLSNIQQVIGR